MLLLVGLALLAQLQLPYEQVLNTQDKFYLFFIFFTFSSIRVTYGTKSNLLKPLSKAGHTVHRARLCGKLTFPLSPSRPKGDEILTPSRPFLP
jgi:hypothetical protein